MNLEIVQDTYAFVASPKSLIIPENSFARYAHYVAAQNGFFYFAEHVCGFPPQPFHREWIETVEKHERVCIMSSRDHAKTTYVTVLYPLWKAWHNENYEIFIFSASEDLAKDLLLRIKLLTDLPYFNDMLLFPNMLIYKKKKNLGGWGSTELTFGNKSRIIAKGYGSANRGPHPQIVICDDVLTDKTQLSDEMIEQIFYQAISPMPLEKLIVVGTPQHYKDLLHQLFENKIYVSKKYPAIIDEEKKKVLWPQRWSYEKLMRRKEEIGEINFSKEYLCNPLDDSSSLFPYKLLESCFDPQLKLTEFGPSLKHVIGCDLAISDSKRADYSVFTVLELTKDKKMRIIDMFRAKGLSYKRQLQEVLKLDARYNPSLIYVEENNFQKMFVQMLQDETVTAPIKGVKTGTEKHSIEVGVPSLRQMFENQKFVIPRGDRYSRQMTDVLVSELVAFGIKEKQVITVAEHDDTVMSLWIALKAARDVLAQSFWFGTLDLE